MLPFLPIFNISDSVAVVIKYMFTCFKSRLVYFLFYTLYIVLSGANIKNTDNMGRNAFLIAAEQGSEKCCSYLIKHEADIHSKDKVGRSALFYALHSETLSIPVVKKILKSGKKNYDQDVACDKVFEEIFTIFVFLWYGCYLLLFFLRNGT